MKGKSAFALGATVLLVGSAPAHALAQDKMTGSGYSVMGPAESDDIALPDGRIVRRVVQDGFIISTHPDGPFNKMSHSCSATVVTTANGTVTSVGGSCDGIDQDGSVYWLWYRGDASGGTWAFTGGTGRYAGIQGGGTYKAGQAWSDGSVVNTWEGSWTVKK